MIKNLLNVIRNIFKVKAKQTNTVAEPVIEQVVEAVKEPVKKKAGRPKKTTAPTKKATPKKKSDWSNLLI